MFIVCLYTLADGSMGTNYSHFGVAEFQGLPLRTFQLLLTGFLETVLFVKLRLFSHSIKKYKNQGNAEIYISCFIRAIFVLIKCFTLIIQNFLNCRNDKIQAYACIEPNYEFQFRGSVTILLFRRRICNNLCELFFKRLPIT